MRLLTLLAVVAAVLAACSSGAAGGGNQTSLTITFWPDGPGQGGRKTWTLQCDPARGTLDDPAAACRKLARGGSKLVTPVPDGSICTEIWGGPQVARVKGTLVGRRVWARFVRTNGCHISRWDKLSPWLLPPGGVTG